MTRHLDTERLSAWLSGELGERDAGVVRAHIEGCRACAAAEEGLRGQVLAMRALDRPEPPPTLWASIEGALETPARPAWSWRSLLLGALTGAAAVAVVLSAAWGLSGRREAGPAAGGAGVVPGVPTGSAIARAGGEPEEVALDPLVAEAEQELDRAATAYERAIGRLRAILDREQVRWDPESRARVAERLASLDEAVAHSRAVARRAPGDSAGADMLFSAYQRQIDFLAEAVHRGSPGREGLR